VSPDTWSGAAGEGSSGRPEIALLGRERECRALDAVLAAARGGSSAVIVLRGEAGMGKTTLLDYAIRTAEDMEVVLIAGIQSESQFGFGALHRLLVRFMDRTRALPQRQRDAIGAAFGVVNGPPPDRFLIGLAALSVLSDVAAARPLLCVIDDSQWLDRESLDALGLIARQLFAEGAAMLFAARVSSDTAASGGPPLLEGLPALDVSGLDELAALQLVRTLVEDPLDVAVATEAEG
jgi:hypothetical protein